MADVHSKEARSYNMSRIPNKNTKPEIIVRKYLFAKGFRYRLHDRKLPGSPDIVLPKFRTVIFINGCFWHGHESCKYAAIPKTRTAWWEAKIKKNILNDEMSHSRLTEEGWKIIVIWGCELKPKVETATLNVVAEAIIANSLD